MLLLLFWCRARYELPQAGERLRPLGMEEDAYVNNSG